MSNNHAVGVVSADGMNYTHRSIFPKNRTLNVREMYIRTFNV